MGREVRRVPPDWEHPTYPDGHRLTGHIGLINASYKEVAAEWDEGYDQWQQGFCKKYTAGVLGWVTRDETMLDMSYAEYEGERPTPDAYMPDWSDDERTHWMMYENTSEGTPLSPAFETPEALARWLTDNNAAAFADRRASYEQWLATCKQGSVVGAVYSRASGLISGVEASTESD